MGASFCTVFEAEVDPHGTLGRDHLAILRDQPQLDESAADGGLTPLGAFESYDPEDASEFLDEAEVANLPPVQWFAASEGLAAVQALIDHLTARPDVLQSQAQVLADLAGVAAELADADRAGVRFRFAVVP